MTEAEQAIASIVEYSTDILKIDCSLDEIEVAVNEELKKHRDRYIREKITTLPNKLLAIRELINEKKRGQEQAKADSGVSESSSGQSETPKAGGEVAAVRPGQSNRKSNRKG